MDEHGGDVDDDEYPRIRGPAHMMTEEGEDDISEEEEEEECRMCRGPAEEGQPLFKPCKCSGSIGLTHQDCLKQWLEVKRGSRCELCLHKFQFAPKYADGAPLRLSPSEVLLGLTRRATVRWLPLALRALLAASLWLGALPLATAYLYQGWMRRPSSVAGRWRWELVPGDAVSGAVVAAVVVLSFLSLMSFADFLRFHWQNIEDGGDGDAAAAGADGGGARRNDGAGAGEGAPLDAAAAAGPPGAVAGPGDGVDLDDIPLLDTQEGVDNGFLEHDDERLRADAGATIIPDGEGSEHDDAFAEGAAPRQPPPLDRNALGVMDQRELVFPHRRRRRADMAEDGRGADAAGAGDVDVADPRQRRRPQPVQRGPPVLDADARLADIRAQIARGLEEAEAGRAPPQQQWQEGNGGAVGEPPFDGGPEDPLAGRDMGRRGLLAAAAMRRQRRRDQLRDELPDLGGQAAAAEDNAAVAPAEGGLRADEGEGLGSDHRTLPQMPPRPQTPLHQEGQHEALPPQPMARFIPQPRQVAWDQVAEDAAGALNGEGEEGRRLGGGPPAPTDDIFDGHHDDTDDMMERMMLAQQQHEEQLAAAAEEEEENIAQMLRLQEMDDEDDEDDNGLMIPQRGGAGPPGNDPPGQQRQGGRGGVDEFEPQFEPLDPVFDQDDPVDVEIHVALDELLGLRGPLGALIRNLLWLVAFNTTYLGLFAFIPHTLGSTVYSALANSTVVAAGLGLVSRYLPGAVWLLGGVGDNAANSTLAALNTTADMATNMTANATANVTANIASNITTNITANATMTSDVGLGFLSSLVRDLNEESGRVDSLLRLPEVGTISLGYLSMALTVFALQFGVGLYVRFRRDKDNGAADGPAAAGAGAGPGADDGAGAEGPGADDDFDEGGFNRRLLQGGLLDDVGNDGGEEGDEFDDEHGMEMEEDDENGVPRNPADVRAEVGRRLGVGLRCAAAIVKVGLLLFMKMLLLPLVLGIWLDAATLPLFNASLNDRILGAGSDLFGSVLIHWVVGITFMLLVTVSVLQLREVAHPELLARVIRPQEPQPDLLGNLLQEDGTTHAKRVLLSLAIYAALLIVHVWLPARLLVSLGIGRRLPFFQPKIWHVVLPQLQVPLELLIFHLSMLAFLEKYKNHIGNMQHRWLVFMCRTMGLTEHALPREVEKFELVGCRPVFLRRGSTVGSESYGNMSHGSSVEDVGPPSHVDEDAVTDATSSSSAEEDVSGNVHARTEVVGMGFESGNGSKNGPGPVEQVIVLDPFWTQLQALKDDGGGGISMDNYIREHIQPCTQPSSSSENASFAASTREKIGDTKPDGRRVLDECVSYIRLPCPSISSARNAAATSSDESISVADAESNATASSSSTILVPTSIGAYRLQRRARRRSTAPGRRARIEATIEFWREIPGKPIVRPPEGWDDLGVGGAEVQGRWAWGKENMSEIEAGVARRTSFLPKAIDGGWQNPRWWCVVVPLVLKVALLAALSWLAVVVVVCILASAPLSVGRVAFYLLRVPDRCIHDPAAFAVGGAVIFPCFYKMSQALGGGSDKATFGSSLKKWVTSFRRPPRGSNKLRVLVTAVLTWLVLAPLLLGVSYDLFLQLRVPSLALSWGAGFILLHLWAALCYAGAFGRDFWVGIGGGAAAAGGGGGNAGDNAPDAAGADAGVANAAAAGGVVNADQVDRNSTDMPARTRIQPKWQGEGGRIGAFADTISAVAARWEWDKVDRIALLEECSYPVLRQLASTFLVPIALYLICSAFLYLLSGGRNNAGVVPEKSLCHVWLFRSLSLIVILAQLALSFQAPLKRWFHAAHEAARDDRYLVGEILLNYSAPPSCPPVEERRRR